MKKLDTKFLQHLTVVALVFLCSNAFSQEKNHELGIRLGSFENFDFIYKKQRQENKFIRHRLAFVNFAYNTTSDNDSYDLGIGYAIGWENRKEIGGNLFFIHGFEPYISVSHSSNNITNVWGFQPGLGYVLGFQYNFSESFYLNLETIPSLSGIFIIDDDGFSDTFALNAGFNSNAIALTLAYRF